jgi:hypothetical protein
MLLKLNRTNNERDKRFHVKFKLEILFKYRKHECEKLLRSKSICSDALLREEMETDFLVSGDSDIGRTPKSTRGFD